MTPSTVILVCVIQSQEGAYTVFSQMLFSPFMRLAATVELPWGRCGFHLSPSLQELRGQERTDIVNESRYFSGRWGSGGVSAAGIPVVLSWPWTELHRTSSLLTIGVSFTSQTHLFLANTCGKTHMVFHCSKRNLVTD